METLRPLRLLVAFTAGEVLLTLLYAVQTVLGAGVWLVLALLALLAASLTTLSITVWRRAQRRLHIYREEC